MHKVFLVIVIIATLCGSVLMYYTLTSPSDVADSRIPIREEGATTTDKETVVPSEGTITTNSTTPVSKDTTHMPTQKSSAPKEIANEIVAIEGKITLLDTPDSSPITYALVGENGQQVFIDSLYNILLEGILEVERGKGIEPIIVAHGKIETDSKKQRIITDAEFYVRNGGFEVSLDSVVTLGSIDSQGYQEVIYSTPKSREWWGANTEPGKLFLDTKSSSYSQLHDTLKTSPKNFGGLRLTASSVLIVNGMNRGTLSPDSDVVGRFIVTGAQYDIPGYL